MTPSTRWAYVAVAALTVGCSSPTDLTECAHRVIRTDVPAEEVTEALVAADIVKEWMGTSPCLVIDVYPAGSTHRIPLVYDRR